MSRDIGLPLKFTKNARVGIQIESQRSDLVPLKIKGSDGATLFQVEAGGYGAQKYASVTISAAEIAALRATPKTLVAAPGAGKVLEFVSMELYLDYGGVAFTESTDNLQVKYTDGSGVAVSQAIEMTNFIDATADTRTNALPKIDSIVAATGSANAALVLHNTGDGEFGGSGTSVIRAKVVYRIHQTGF